MCTNEKANETPIGTFASLIVQHRSHRVHYLVSGRHPGKVAVDAETYFPKSRWTERVPRRRNRMAALARGKTNGVRWENTP